MTGGVAALLAQTDSVVVYEDRYDYSLEVETESKKDKDLRRRRGERIRERYFTEADYEAEEIRLREEIANWAHVKRYDTFGRLKEEDDQDARAQ